MPNHSGLAQQPHYLRGDVILPCPTFSEPNVPTALTKSRKSLWPTGPCCFMSEAASGVTSCNDHSSGYPRMEILSSFLYSEHVELIICSHLSSESAALQKDTKPNQKGSHALHQLRRFLGATWPPSCCLKFRLSSIDTHHPGLRSRSAETAESFPKLRCPAVQPPWMLNSTAAPMQAMLMHRPRAWHLKSESGQTVPASGFAVCVTSRRLVPGLLEGFLRALPL